jgi:hypothetical protein
MNKIIKFQKMKKRQHSRQNKQKYIQDKTTILNKKNQIQKTTSEKNNNNIILAILIAT